MGKLLNQIDSQIDHFTGDGAYDETSIYEEVLAHSSNAKVVIPPRKNAILMSLHHHNVIKVLWKYKKMVGWNGNDKITMVNEIIVSLVCRDIRGLLVKVCIQETFTTRTGGYDWLRCDQ